MKITYPYEIEINSREEAMDYLRHQCDKCPYYSANWDCSGAQVAKCMETLKVVRDAFKRPDYDKLEKEGRIIILPVPLDSKVYEVRTGYSFGEVGDKSEPWYYIEEITFDLDNYYWFGDTVFATKEEAEKRVEELKKENNWCRGATSNDVAFLFAIVIIVLWIRRIIMRINYSDEDVVKNEKSIFLAGPTPRNFTLAKWRIEACKYLEEIGFDGTVYIPEYKSAKNMENVLEQELWEREALSNASVILFWVPRELPDMPAFTTNVEFGYWLHSGKVIYGRPDESEKNGYLDWLYETDTNEKPFNDLEKLLDEAKSRADKIGVWTKPEVLPLKNRQMMN